MLTLYELAFGDLTVRQGFSLHPHLYLLLPLLLLSLLLLLRD